jgi:L-alanine-DL-glutamate epimerase-like enolase superfamily enzyme
MTTPPTIDSLNFLDVRSRTEPGDDGLFVSVHGQGRTGWYGPVADDHLQPLKVLAGAVPGQSITDHQALQKAMRNPFGPQISRAESWAIGAVDCASWDLHGQLVGLPVAEILVPSAVTTVPLYASWLSLDLTTDSAADSIATVGRTEWLFTKWGVRRTSTDTHAEAVRLARAAQAATDALGLAAAFDAVFTWDPALTSEFSSLVEPGKVIWLEDPLPAAEEAAYPTMRCPAKLAFGESLNIDSDIPTILTLRPSALTIDIIGCGGLTRAVDVVLAACEEGVPVFPHGRSFVPAVHLAAAYPHVVTAVEYRLQWEPRRQRMYTEPWRPVRGRIALPDQPGLGANPRSH